MLISTFPTHLKMSGVIPIRKKKDITNIDNYERYIWPNIFLRWSNFFKLSIRVSLVTYLIKLFTAYDCKCRPWVNDDQVEKGRLIDLSKASDCTNRDLQVARLAGYGIIYESLFFFFKLFGRREAKN